MDSSMLQPDEAIAIHNTQQLLPDQNVQPANGFDRPTANNANAVLFLFAPKNHANQVIRPVVYNINNSVINSLENIADRSTSSMVDSSGMNIQQAINQDSTLQRAVMPSADQAISVDMGLMSSTFSFVLIIDTPISTIMNNTIPTMKNTKELYSGWVCLAGDLPCANITNGEWLIPDDMILSINHYTRFSVVPSGGYSSTGAVGSMRCILDRDTDVITSDLLGLVSTGGKPLYSLDLKNINSAAMINESLGMVSTGDNRIISDGFSPAPLGYTANSTGSTAVTQDTMDKNPGTLTQDLCWTWVNVATADNSDVFQASSSAADYRNDLVTGCTVSTDDTLSGRQTLDITKPVTVYELRQLFPALQPVVLTPPRDAAYDISDPGSLTPNNIGVAIVSNALPSIMANTGVCEVAFVYDSAMTNQYTNRQGVIQWYKLDTFTPAATSFTLQNSANAIYSKLQGQVFNKLLSNFGHFRLYVSYSAIDNTIIKLDLYDYSSFNQAGVNEVSNIIGGVNTSLIGTKQNLMTNADQLTAMARGLYDSVARNQAFNSVNGQYSNYYL